MFCGSLREMFVCQDPTLGPGGWEREGGGLRVLGTALGSKDHSPLLFRLGHGQDLGLGHGHDFGLGHGGDLGQGHAEGLGLLGGAEGLVHELRLADGGDVLVEAPDADGGVGDGGVEGDRLVGREEVLDGHRVLDEDGVLEGRRGLVHGRDVGLGHRQHLGLGHGHDGGLADGLQLGVGHGHQLGESWRSFGGAEEDGLALADDLGLREGVGDVGEGGAGQAARGAGGKLDSRAFIPDLRI